jgi:hypothetical protein
MRGTGATVNSPVIQTEEKLKALLGLLIFAASAFGSTCMPEVYTAGGPPLGACTVGTVDFTSFDFVGLTKGEQVNVSFYDGSNAGGVSFQFSPAIVAPAPFTVGYTATVSTGDFTSINDSATPGGRAAYDYLGSGFACAPNAILCNASTLPSSLLVNTATYTGATSPVETISLNFTLDPPDKITASPEPAALSLFGLGFAALGFVKFKRKP